MPETKISVHYLKSLHFRECHVDGAVGGATTKTDHIWLGLYSERGPIPAEAVHTVVPVDSDPDIYQLGELIPDETKTKLGIIRTMEVGLHLDLATAKQIHDWLGKHISALEEQAR